jgi:hypothetical protein
VHGSTTRTRRSTCRRWAYRQDGDAPDIAEAAFRHVDLHEARRTGSRC